MKIVFHSNAPWVPTGYGNQCGIFTPLIRDAGHDVAISTFWGLEGKTLDWEGMRVYPSDGEWGNRWLVGNAAHHAGADGKLRDVLTITLMDVWVLTSPLLSQLRMASWVPVDHDPAPPRVVEFFTRTKSTPIAMSKFGREMLYAADLDPLYVPHGVDTMTLRPVDRATAREQLGISPDAFLVGMVAANKGVSPSRKGFPQAFEAFARLRKDHPDAMLYLHTKATAGGEGLNLIALAETCGIPPDSLAFAPEYAMSILGIDQDAMAHVYSAMDVLLSPSYGEGFGIPIMEAQACGTPVIVTDFSAMPELCGSGWKVGGERWYDATQGAWFMAPSVDLVADALEHAYSRAEMMRDRARNFALGYDCRVVLEEFWKPALAKIDNAYQDEAQMPIVTLDRASRRRMARAK